MSNIPAGLLDLAHDELSTLADLETNAASKWLARYWAGRKSEIRYALESGDMKRVCVALDLDEDSLATECDLELQVARMDAISDLIHGYAGPTPSDEPTALGHRLRCTTLWHAGWCINPNDRARVLDQFRRLTHTSWTFASDVAS